SFTRSRMRDAEQQFRILPGLHDCRVRPKLQSIIPYIERRCPHKIHAASWTLAGDVHREVAVHWADPGLLRVRVLRNRDEGEKQCQADRQENRCDSHKKTI